MTRGRRVEVFAPVVLPDSERVESGLIGQLDLFHQLAEPPRGLDRETGVVVGRGETVNPNLHCWFPFVL
jgi:hypothetical protein